MANGVGTLLRLAVRSISSRPERLAAALRSSWPAASCRAGLRTHQTRWDFSFMGAASNVTEADACFSGHQIEELSLTLPPGRDIELLPKGKTIENPYMRYQSDWNRDGQVVTVRHEIAVKLPVAVCRDTIRAKLAEAIAEIRGDYRARIALKPLAH
jgi:hypothetical protein